jgi:regulator of vacuolar morphogenesis
MSSWEMQGGRADRDDLFGGSGREGGFGGARSGGRAFGARSDDFQEQEHTQGLDNQGLLTLQKNTMDEQDRALEALGASIGRTKEVAIAIGDEADLQNQLIEDIHDKVDHADTRLRNTTRRVDRVKAKASTKGMWACICFLLLGLIGITIAATQT